MSVCMHSQRALASHNYCENFVQQVCTAMVGLGLVMATVMILPVPSITASNGKHNNYYKS